MAELTSCNEAAATFSVLRRARVMDGSRYGLAVRVIQEADKVNGYVIFVSNDGRIGWVNPAQIR